jgi:hypothetical protein
MADVEVQRVWDRIRSDFRAHVLHAQLRRDQRARHDARLQRRGQQLRAATAAAWVLAAVLWVASTTLGHDALWAWLPWLLVLDAAVLAAGAAALKRPPVLITAAFLGAGVPLGLLLLQGAAALGVTYEVRLVLADAVLSLWYHAPAAAGLGWGLAAGFERGALPLAARLEDALAERRAAAAHAESPSLETALARSALDHFDDVATFVELRLAESVRHHRVATEAAARAARDQLARLDADLADAVRLSREPDALRAELDAEAAPARARLRDQLATADRLLQEAARVEHALRARFQSLAALKADHDRDARAREASRRARAAIAASGATSAAVDAQLVDSATTLEREVSGLLRLLQSGDAALAAERELAGLEG